MIAIISSAKTMTGASKAQIPDKTIPCFQKEANEIAKCMLQYSSMELAHILKINQKMANENYYRYQHFFAGEISSLQSILAYTGIVYKNMNPRDFTCEDFHFAQETLRIASFLYGLLSPLDLIKPYRMESNVELTELDEASLYDYWSSKFTKALLADIKKSGNVLINLASAENFSLFNRKEASEKIHIITPVFKILKNTKMQTPVVYIKMARGQMVRFIIKNKITDPEILKTFQWEGFKYNEELSDKKNWVFLNGQ